MTNSVAYLENRMSTISISLSQSVVTTLAAMKATNGATIASDIVDVFFNASANFSASHPYYASASSSATTARFTYADGGYQLYSGVTGLGSSGSGTANATSIDMYWPGYYRLTTAGKFNVAYSYTATGVTTSPATGTITAATLQTLLPSYSSLYDATLGNVSMTLGGQINLTDGGGFAGTLTSYTSRAEKFTDTVSIAGNFSVAGNAVMIAQGMSHTNLSGTLTAYAETYRDGSYARFTELGIGVTGNTVLDEALLANPLNFPGNDVISVSLPASLPSPYVIAAGAGNDVVTLKGGGGRLSVQAGDGNDAITLQDSGHAVDGGAGSDTVTFGRALSAYALTRSGSTYVVKDKAAGSSDTLTNAESLRFADLTVNLAAKGIAAAAPAANVDRLIELYVAFFNRVPDADGLVYWIGQMQAGAKLDAIAATFYNAGVQYGSVTGYAATMTDADFINVVYRNVLGRPGGADAGGLDYWTGKLASGAATRGALVSTILDSAHTFKGDATYGYVADLLDNKIAVAKTIAVDWGINYNTPADSITRGMAIAAAITPTDTASAIALVGIAPGDIVLG